MSDGIRILDIDREEEQKEEGIKILTLDPPKEGITVLETEEEPTAEYKPVWQGDDPRIQIFQEANYQDIADFENGTGLTLRDAYAKVDAIATVMKMTGRDERNAETIVEASRLAWGSEPVNIADLSDKLRDAYNTQRISMQVADIYNQMGQTRPTEPSGRPAGPGDVLGAVRTQWDDYRDQIEQLRSEMPAQTYSDNATFMEKSLIGLTQQLPIWLDMAEGAGRLALPVAMTLGGLSVATGGAALPLFTAGVSAAAAIGGAQEMRSFIRGTQFGEFMDLEDEEGNTMDPRLAWAWADMIGAGESILEMAQIGAVYKAFGTRAAKSAAKSAMGRAIAKMTSSSAFNNTVMQATGRVLKGTAEQSVEEGVQEAWSLLGEYFAKEISNDKSNTEFQQTSFQEGVKAAWDETTNAAVSFWLTQIPGGINVAMRPQVAKQTISKPAFEITDPVKTEEELFEPGAIEQYEMDADNVAEMEEIDAARAEADAFTPEMRPEMEDVGELSARVETGQATFGEVEEAVEVSVGADAATFSTAAEFIDFANAMSVDDEIKLTDEELTQIWEEAQPEERFVPLEVANAEFVEDIKTPEGLDNFIGELGVAYTTEIAKLRDDGLSLSEANRALGNVWDHAVLANARRVSAGNTLTDASRKSLAGKIAKSPGRYRLLLASVTGDTETVMEIQKQETLSDEAVRAEEAVLEEDAAAKIVESREIETTPPKRRMRPEKARPKVANYDTIEEYVEAVKDAGLGEDTAEIVKAWEEAHPDKQKVSNKVKNSIRDMLGTEIEQPKITDKEALILRLKSEARGARTGVAEGKRLRMASEKARKDKAAVRKYFKDTAEYITKDRRTAPINIAQKRAIAAIGEGLEPRFFSAKTLYKNEALRKHLERHPEEAKNIPRRLLSKAFNKPLNDFTIGELEERAQIIADLEKEGRMIQKVRDRVDKQRRDTAINTMVDAMLRGKEIEEPTQLGGVFDKRNKTSLKSTLRASTLNIQRILDSWDGYQDFQGPAHDTFWNAVQDMTDNRLRETAAREKVARAKRIELGIKVKDITQPIEKDSRYSRDQVISMYMLMQNDKGAAALIHGNKLTVEEVNGFIDKLTEDEKAWGDWIIEHGYEDHYDRVNEAFVEYTTASGVPQDMGAEDRYSPINRVGQDGGSFLKDLQNEALERAGLKDAYAARGFTMDRVEEIKPEHQIEVRLGATREFFSQIKKQENFIANATALKDFHKIVNDEKFRNAVKEKDGGTARLKQLEGFINTQAQPNFFANMDESAKGLKKVVRGVRHNTATAALGYNLRTMIQTLPSSLLMMPESGVKNYVWGMTQAAAHPVETQKLMQSQPQIAARSIDKMMEEMQSENPSAYKKLMQKNGKAAFMGLWLFDRAAITPGWMGVYHKFKLAGETDAVAAREATSAIGRTQVGGSSKDVAGMYRTDDEWIAGALQFTTQLSQIYQMVSYDMPANAARGVRALKEGNIKEFMSAFAKSGGAGLMIAASNAMIWSIKHGRPPETEEDIKEMILTGLTNELPVIGGDVTAGVMGYDDQGNPLEDLANQMGKLSGIKRGMNAKKRLSWFAEKAAMGIFGGPVVQAKRIKKTIETGDLMELLGGVKR